MTRSARAPSSSERVSIAVPGAQPKAAARPDVGRDVLPLGGKASFPPGGLQGGEGEHLHVEAVRVGATQGVADVVVVALDEGAHHLVYHRWIGKRAVARDPPDGGGPGG